MTWFVNWPQYKVGKERLEKEADHSILVGAKFNKQGNLVGYKTSRCPHPPARKLRVYRERDLNWAQSGIPFSCSQHPTSTWRLCPLGSFWTPIRQAGSTFQAEEGEELLIAQVSSQINQRSRPLNDLLQQCQNNGCHSTPKTAHDY